MRYGGHMRRMTFVLDAPLLEAAMCELQTKTYSATVNLALQEVIRMRRIQTLSRFFGKGLWHGGLSEMREDRHTGKRRSRVR